LVLAWIKINKLIHTTHTHTLHTHTHTHTHYTHTQIHTHTHIFIASPRIFFIPTTIQYIVSTWSQDAELPIIAWQLISWFTASIVAISRIVPEVNESIKMRTITLDMKEHVTFTCYKCILYYSQNILKTRHHAALPVLIAFPWALHAWCHIVFCCNISIAADHF